MLRALFSLLLMAFLLVYGKKMYKRLEDDEFGYGGC